ncbi:hypothetical protein PHAVU_001G253101 [Phaseolus vulgaris]
MEVIVLLLFLLKNDSVRFFCCMQDPSYEEKNRLGSMPPTCHNKCNQCHPCMAVQVPSLSRNNRVHPVSISPSAAMQSFFLQGNRYSNYKPLSWKCHCGDQFFNP